MQNSACVEGINLIPKSGNTLVVTKSYKDVIILTQFGVPSISPPGESSREAIEVVKELSYNKIISLMDFDYTGIKSANHLRKTYGIEPYFLTNGRFSTPDYGAKDISDYLFKLKKLQNENS